MDELIEALAVYPFHGREWKPSDDALAGVRVRKVAGFPRLIFYIVMDNRILVLRAMHGARGDLMQVIADELVE